MNAIWALVPNWLMKTVAALLTEFLYLATWYVSGILSKIMGLVVTGLMMAFVAFVIGAT